MANQIVPYHARPDTLAYYKGQPLFLAQSWRELEVPTVAAAAKAYMAKSGLRRPEAEATQFYALNAIFAELSKRFAAEEPLPPWAKATASFYVQEASRAAQRLLHYLLVIITRESRHAYHTIHSAMGQAHGKAFADFNKYLSTAPTSMAAKGMFFDQPPDMKLGAFVDAIVWTFRNAGFSGGFGGEKWAVVADAFKALVDGHYSPEMVTDVAWALCHNGGPIFNKEMVYNLYDEHTLLKILDVQRSGQIPQFVAAQDYPHWAVYPLVRTMVATAQEKMPGVFGNTVDWAKVEKDGAKQNYAALKQAQFVQANKGKVYVVTPGVMVAIVDKERTA